MTEYEKAVERAAEALCCPNGCRTIFKGLCAKDQHFSEARAALSAIGYVEGKVIVDAPMPCPFPAIYDEGQCCGKQPCSELAEPADTATNEMQRALERCRTVLSNMAMENEGAIFNRWPISHEPLRNDARGLLPVIAAALGEAA